MFPDRLSVREWRDVDLAILRDEIVPAGMPALLRGLAARWPAVQAGDPAAYLRTLDNGQQQSVIVAPPDVGGRFGYAPDMSRLNFESRTASVTAVLDRLEIAAAEDSPSAFAAQAIPVDTVLPGFSEANPMPLAPAAAPRIWIGNRVAVATHHDLNSNIAVAMAGRRRFTLFPPEQVGNLYIGPFEFTPAGTPISLADPEAPDLVRFPRFADALAAAQTAELEPGDALYIPYMWWHHVRSLDPISILVNYWWTETPPPQPGLGPFDAMMHALLAFEGLPREQRDAWSAMFSHFVFHADGPPAEHVPVARRGLQGTISADAKTRLRRQIGQLLSR